MSVHIGELTSEVIPEPEQAGAGAQGAPEPEAHENVRRAHARLVRDLRRTAAEGFDD